MKRVILSALAAGIFATAAAQEELTLRKCLEIGLENNYEKNDVESKDLTSFFFYLKILEIMEVLL